MTAQLSLPVCAIPGCRNIVGEIGVPCQECVDAFGDMLQHNPGGRRMTEAEITERDEAVHMAYRIARLRGVL